MTKDIRDLVEEKKSVGIKKSSPVTKLKKAEVVMAPGFLYNIPLECYSPLAKS